ncbi:MAG: O-antigen ligase family protein [Candidatus Binataceae bacterium]
MPPAWMVIVLAAASVLLAMSVLLGRLYAPVAALAGLALLIALFKAAAYTRQHPEWIVLPIFLTFALISASSFTEAIRAPIHYGLLVLFCLPVVPVAWRSGIIGQGGFRLYCMYLAWAAFTIVYSIAPAYSAARLIEATLVIAALVAAVARIHSADDVERLLSHFFLGCELITLAIAVSFVALPHAIAWVSPIDSLTPDILAEMHRMGQRVGGLDRFRAIFNGPNDVGAFMLITVGVGLARWPRIHGRDRIITTCTILAALTFGAIADSRSPFAALLVGIVLYLVWKKGFRGVLYIVGAGAICAIVLAGAGHDLGRYVDRGDVTTLTGRTEMWGFVVHSIRDRPLFGYGYEVGGAIFDSPYFPLWWGPWDQGPHVSVHNGYLAHAVGVGIPVTIFWLYIMLRPWIFILKQRDDAWLLKPVLFLVLVPILIHNLTEVMADDATGTVGFLFGLVWVIAERYRLSAIAAARETRAEEVAAMPRAVAALSVSR